MDDIQQEHSQKTCQSFKTPERIVTKSASRGRTPSGQICANSYKDIRELFQRQISSRNEHDKDDSPSRKHKRASQVENLKVQSLSLGYYQHDKHQSTAINCEELEQPSDYEYDCCEFESDNLHTSKSDPLNSVNSNSMMATEGDINRQHMSVDQMQEILQTDNEEKQHQLLEKYPKTMDIMTVLEMFKEIKIALAENSTRLEKVESQKESGRKSDEETSIDNPGLQSVHLEVQALKKRNRFLNGHLSRVTQEMRELQSRIEMMEINNAKRMLILTGHPITKKKGDGIRDLECFFDSKMSIQPAIEDFFFMNAADQSNVVITFQTVYDKKLVFQNMDKLKNPKVGKYKKYSFHDYYIPATNEKRRRERTVMQRFKQEEGAKQEDMEFGKGGLYFKNKLYQKLVPLPDPTSILKMQLPQVEGILAYKITKGKEERYEGNTFVPYAIDTTNPDEIKKAYLHVKLQHPSARHIVCAYRLPGYPQHEYNDYQDDGEFGAGEKLLQMLEANDIPQKAVFVARYCGPQKIGNKRFDMYVEAAKNLLKITNVSGRTQTTMFNFTGRSGNDVSANNTTGTDKQIQNKFTPTPRGRRQNSRGNGRGRHSGKSVKEHFKPHVPHQNFDNTSPNNPRKLSDEEWPLISPGKEQMET